MVGLCWNANCGVVVVVVGGREERGRGGDEIGGLTVGRGAGRVWGGVGVA